MEIRLNEVVLAGRMLRGPEVLADGTVHFMFEADQDQKPFHCFCSGATAENLGKFCQQGDEFSIEGKLRWKTFSGESRPTLLVEVRYVSYGRKQRTLR